MTASAPIKNSSAAQLQGFVTEVEEANERIKEWQAHRKNIYQTAAGAGINVRALKQVIKERAMDRDDLDEFEALVNQYWNVLGK
jgi:uncharacterized protein (UPF0335 family)